MAYVTGAAGALPSWLRHVEARSVLEAVFFRAMALPGGDVLYRRPPKETRAALSELLQKQPQSAELYSLRALEDEQQLDFTAAENDWKQYVANSAAKPVAQLALADFYHRRLRPLDEIQALSLVATTPPEASESLIAPAQQRSWQAFERIFGIIQAQGLPKDVSVAQYRSWIGRYPKEPSLYLRFLDFLLAQKEYSAANRLIAEYRTRFPGDQIFPVKAKALVEFRQGSLQQGLAVYDQTFQPLWEPELIAGYFELLSQTHNLRKFLDDARAAAAKNPEDLSATARVFYYYQQQGKLDAAQETITKFRLHKDQAKSAWTPQELYTCARLLEDIHIYPEAARFYFALYNAKGTSNEQERSLAGLARLLLTAPETPIRLGSGELSMYRDIATMDQGPGYLNGILSLLLNSTSPASEFSQEEQRAVPYFHRSRAAELLALLDSKAPDSSERPALHAKLLEFYSSSAESEAVIKAGKEFLSAFPNAYQRTDVALLMADAYARTRRASDEFAIYDSVLSELAARAKGIPLGLPESESQAGEPEHDFSRESATEDENEADSARASESAARSQVASRGAFQLSATAAQAQATARSPEYARVLERYLARLVELKQISQALAVLRREIDHNPDDPGLYERLAQFLNQNRLEAEQEAVYQRAMGRFPERTWYHKLARYYLRRKQNAEFANLTQQVVKAFSGTDLERYFTAVVGGTPELYLQLNLYANQRFPHNPAFVRNLLNAYLSPRTLNWAAWEALLRKHWFEEADLRNRFFEFLSRTGKLDAELAQLRQQVPTSGKWDEFVAGNPAAGAYLAEAAVWRSHYEESAPILKALAEQYPAGEELGRTASSVFRSLAFFDPANTAVAAKISSNLLAWNPGSTKMLAGVGDIYADRERFSDAAPYWERIPRVAPGESGGYLEAATIYWDYFDFDNALRLIGEGRKKLENESLYCYEAGAIYEGKRQYRQAIQEYVKGSLASGVDSPSAYRLLDLVRRPKYRDQVDHETEQRTADSNNSAGVHLRVRVLETLDRKKELVDLLDGVVARANTIEQASEIEALAAQKSLESVREHALEKEASLASDPVLRLQLRYSLTRLYESHKDISAAQRNYEALYRENPKVLGVVRSTVDFYWRTKSYSKAIEVLEQSAKAAYPELAKQFTFEAARKSTEAKQYAHARELLTQLLKDSPYDSQTLAATADTYAQAGDQLGLKQFYLDKIALFRTATLSADDKKAQIATLRRGLIPALTRLQDYAGVVDQYIELLNAYPEDEGLITESALYALRHQRQKQLVDFYAKTVQQSPRDYRWSMVLGRIYTSLEDFPAAIDTFGKSIAVRPDRVDLRVARADLNERLMHFDDAAADYERIYQLAYKDPKWMEKIAEIRARQGQTEAAVTALKAALIDGRPERPENYFEVASRLESWAMLPQARSYAEQGVTVAAGDLLAVTENHSGATLYARIMTKLRQQEKAYTTLHSALTAASAILPVLQQQVAKEGIAAVTDAELRKRMQETRIENARNGMSAALTEMGGTVARYFAPEEKVAFAQLAERLRTPMSPADVQRFAVPVAQSAGLAELEAKWRYEGMLEQANSPNESLSRMVPYIDLQRRRLKLAELGERLESFAGRVPGLQRPYVLLAAADAYRSAADPESDLRILSQTPVQYMSRDVQTHYLELLLARRPQQLVQMAADWTPWSQQVSDFVVANGDAALAHAVVAARAAGRPPVWASSYNALAGLYFAEPAPEVSRSFVSALGDETIGERLGSRGDRNTRLAGDIWYYYGSRYGEYLGLNKQAGSDDFLAAVAEQSPASSSGYLQLADYYSESGDFRAAISDYNHALELAPGSIDVRDQLALAYSRQGNRKEALAQWKTALTLLAKQVNTVHPPESFWTGFARICDHLGSRRLFVELKPDVDSLLRAYLRRNGNYRSNAPLHSAFVALRDSAAGVAWLIELSSAALDPSLVLADIVDASWIPLKQRAPIYTRILEARQNAFEKAEGIERENALTDLRNWQVRWLNYLIVTEQFQQAADSIASLPAETRLALQSAITPLELRAAAKLGTLDGKIAGYRSDPQSAPGSETLRQSARALLEAGDKPSARKLLEFVFARELDQHNLVAANFLGLAEIRLIAGDTAGALELLRRLVVVVGNPFENLDPAASLLEKTGHSGEAIEFLEKLVKAAPWEPAYRVRLAKANIASARDLSASQAVLVNVGTAADLPYALRAEAASALAGAHATGDLPSGELNALAHSAFSPATANQRFFYDLRLRSAQAASDRHTRFDLLLGALAETPARDDARIPLFNAASSQHADEVALVAIDPLLKQRILETRVVSDKEQDELASVEESDESSSDEAEGQVHPSARLTAAQRAQLAATMAEVLIRLDRLNQALPYLELARKLEKTPSRRNELNASLTDVKARLHRRQTNLARQPILHQALEQDRVVRPRLVARAAVASSSPPNAPGKGDRP
jgi:tetratricopeptide (TPR) repeat protein